MNTGLMLRNLRNLLRMLSMLRMLLMLLMHRCLWLAADAVLVAELDTAGDEKVFFSGLQRYRVYLRPWIPVIIVSFWMQ
jgi:hypothetical protein